MIIRSGIILLAAVLSVIISSAYAQSISNQQSDNLTLNVEIKGIDNKLLENARALLTIAAMDGQPAPSVFRVRYLSRQGETEIQTALQPFGYYHAEITHELVQTDEQWLLTFTVDAGPPTRYDQINIEVLGAGADDPEFQRVLNRFAPQQNDILVHDKYEQLKAQLRNLAAERGYYDAIFLRNQVKVERSTQLAQITLTFDAGHRYTFGPTTFSNAELSDTLLQRFLKHSTGAPFTTRDLLDLQVGLSSTEYFNTVEVTPRWDLAENYEVPIAVALTPNKRDRYQVGPGYGTDTGARLTLGFDRRWLNDRGHRLSSKLRLSEVQNTGFVSYIIPGNDPAKDSYSLTGEVSDRSFEQQRSTLTKISASDLRHYDRWHRTYQLSYQREDYSFGDEPTATSNFLIPTLKWSLIQSKSLAANRNIIDDGFRVSFQIEGAHDSVLADTTFVSATASAKWVQRLNEHWRFLARGEIGALKAGSFDTLSPSLRFFAGGDHSIRGYAYQQLGPENSEGVVVGGRYLLTSSFEVDYAISTNWRVAVFTDLGNSMMDWQESLKQSVGVGVRWVSPIGPVRLDLAQAIDEPGKPWRIHFTLGPDL